MVIRSASQIVCACLAAALAGFVLTKATLAPAQERAPETGRDHIHERAADPKACAPADRLQPDSVSPKAGLETTGENLSDRLARTDGVICPPDVGPDIRLKAPDAGTTPVIPPPGGPGGDPTVRPK